MFDQTQIKPLIQVADRASLVRMPASNIFDTRLSKRTNHRPSKTSTLKGNVIRPHPHVSGYFRIRNFFFPDTATVHSYPANLTANPGKTKSALQSGKKYIHNESDNMWTGESRYFESDDVKSVSSLSPSNKPIWRLT